MHFCSMPMYLICLVHHSIDDVQTSNSTSRNAAADYMYNLQRVLHRQVQKLQFEHFTRKPPRIRVGLVSKQAEGAFIADQDLLPHPTTLPGTLPCPVDSL